MLELKNEPLIAILKGEKKEIKAYEELTVVEGERIGIIVARTPFYPKGGGQEGDKGTIRINNIVIDVDEVIEPVERLIVHWGTVHIIEEEGI